MAETVDLRGVQVMLRSFEVVADGWVVWIAAMLIGAVDAGKDLL